MTELLQADLEDASREELQSALQLLAVSIVQHRAKCGFVAFQESASELQSGAGSANGLFSKGHDILQEALSVARKLTSETAATFSDQPEPAGSIENRRQLRINVRAPIKVVWDAGAEPVPARLQNISWGGAAIEIANLPHDAHDKLQILLPTARGGEIRIEAVLLRTWTLDDGAGYGMATRFSSLSTRDETEFEKLLELLSQSRDEDGQREHARLTQRLEIEFDGEQALQATLDDISAGGLGITVPDPLEIGQSLQAIISTMDGNCTLKLRARVVRQNVITHGKVTVYHAGLQFEHPSDELRELTDSLIEKMAGSRR